MATASRAVAGFIGLVARRGIVSKGRSKARKSTQKQEICSLDAENFGEYLPTIPL